MKKIKKFGKEFLELDEFEISLLYIFEIILGFLSAFLISWITESLLGIIFLFFVWMGIIHIENLIFHLKEKVNS